MLVSLTPIGFLRRDFQLAWLFYYPDESLLSISDIVRHFPCAMILLGGSLRPRTGLGGKAKTVCVVHSSFAGLASPDVIWPERDWRQFFTRIPRAFSLPYSSLYWENRAILSERKGGCFCGAGWEHFWTAGLCSIPMLMPLLLLLLFFSLLYFGWAGQGQEKTKTRRVDMIRRSKGIEISSHPRKPLTSLPPCPRPIFVDSSWFLGLAGSKKRIRQCNKRGECCQGVGLLGRFLAFGV
jgi:hypothetical protein